MLFAIYKLSLILERASAASGHWPGRLGDCGGLVNVRAGLDSEGEPAEAV
jgi:hypothetical protein